MKINKPKLHKIIEHFGKFHQVIKLGEEIGELDKAILNYEGGYTRTNNEITNELADCYILLKQIELMYEIDKSELRESIVIKVDRVFDKYNVN